jgi:hypothetical protein
LAARWVVDFEITLGHKMEVSACADRCCRRASSGREEPHGHRHSIQAEHSGRTFKQGELDTMDTSDFDKQAHQHLSIYNGVMTASKIVIGLVILTLVVMAATLL